MKDESKITYWVDINGTRENILSFDTKVVPKVNEEIYINTKMDKDWYDRNFPNDKLFNEGIRGNFIVTEIKRYYRQYHTKSIEKIGDKEYIIPSHKTMEEFEVFIEEID